MLKITKLLEKLTSKELGVGNSKNVKFDISNSNSSLNQKLI